MIHLTRAAGPALADRLRPHLPLHPLLPGRHQTARAGPHDGLLQARRALSQSQARRARSHRAWQRRRLVRQHCRVRVLHPSRQHLRLRSQRP